MPGLEYLFSDLPPQVHFVGALLATPPADTALPAWWVEVTAKQRPVVLMTQGTFATDPRELIVAAVASLAGEELLVLVVGASPEALDLGTIPANVQITPFIPFGLTLPHVNMFVTNGGFGGVQYALANGVPMVIGGATEDKPEVANRVARAGVGINLKTARPRTRSATPSRRSCAPPATANRRDGSKPNWHSTTPQLERRCRSRHMIRYIY